MLLPAMNTTMTVLNETSKGLSLACKTCGNIVATVGRLMCDCWQACGRSASGWRLYKGTVDSVVERGDRDVLSIVEEA